MSEIAPETAAPETGADAPEVSELDRLAAENAALKERVLRIAADAENAKRRAEKEANDGRAYAIQRFARDLLDAADNLARAVAYAPKEVEDAGLKNFVAGVTMTEKALQTAFERNGLKRVEPARGDRFDPHQHQAMMEQAAEDVGPGAVVAVMQPGYELFGRIVRPAMVAVAPKSAPAAAPAADPYAPSDAEAGGAVDRRA